MSKPYFRAGVRNQWSASDATGLSNIRPHTGLKGRLIEIGQGTLIAGLALHVLPLHILALHTLALGVLSLHILALHIRILISLGLRLGTTRTTVRDSRRRGCGGG
jgi:hypothetical protein